MIKSKEKIKPLLFWSPGIALLLLSIIAVILSLIDNIAVLFLIVILIYWIPATVTLCVTYNLYLRFNKNTSRKKGKIFIFAYSLLNVILLGMQILIMLFFSWHKTFWYN